MGKCELPFAEEAVAPARPLSACVLEQARTDLGEDQQSRERALRELRAWIGRHRLILTCREGQSESHMPGSAGARERIPGSAGAAH